MHSTPSTNFLGVPALFGAQNLNLGLFYPRFGSNFGEIRSRTIEIDWNGLGPLWTHIGPALGPSKSPGAAQGHVGPKKVKVPRLSSNFQEIRPGTVETDRNGLRGHWDPIFAPGGPADPWRTPQNWGKIIKKMKILGVLQGSVGPPRGENRVPMAP